MNWEVRIALGLALLLVLLSLPACNQPPLSTLETSTQAQEQAVDTKDTTVDDHKHSTPNFDGIAHALGCIFAPASCD